jgi:hypothetical protein
MLAVKATDFQRLERAERMMIRWMCGVSLKQRIHTTDLVQRLAIIEMSAVVHHGSLRWFGHVEHVSRQD